MRIAVEAQPACRIAIDIEQILLQLTQSQRWPSALAKLQCIAHGAIRTAP